MIRTVRSAEYNPSLPRTGSTGDYVFRMSNLIKRGRGDSSYFEVGGVPESLSESIGVTALTGTIALTLNSTTVTGTGTLFTTELHLGQFFFVLDSVGVRSHLCVVERIISDTSVIIAVAPTYSVSGKTGYRMPVIFPVDTQRGTALRGNVVRLDKGTLFSVGDGTFRLNGSAISATLALTRTPKVSIYNSGAGTYTHFNLGLPTPATPTVTNVAGGTKGMQPGSYSIVITAERAEYTGFGNPSARADVTIAAGERLEINFGAMDATSGQSAWGVWGTRYIDFLGADKNYLNGPWFRVMCGSGPNGQVLAADLTANKIITEWLDGEIESNELVTFDNDPPPKAEFVSVFNGVPVWISCAGPGDTSPGPFIFPAKPSNIEAAPTQIAYPTSPPETILGVFSALGRLYFLTTNHLQVGIGTSNDLAPIVIQPFWKAGFKNPYQLTFVSGVLYGCTTAGPTRSVSSGDQQEEERTWAAAIGELSKNWVMAHVLVAHDPLNDAICFFHSADSLNINGYWTTKVYMWGLTQEEWIGNITLSASSGDCIVSGVATVGNHLEFLMGGRLGTSSTVLGTYRFDTGTTSTDYYLAAQYSDFGSEERPHVIKGIRATGKLTDASLKVYGAGPSGTLNVTDIENGTNALATVTIANTTNVVQGQINKVNVKNLSASTVKLEGRWAGSDSRDRIDEIAIHAEIVGSRK